MGIQYPTSQYRSPEDSNGWEQISSGYYIKNEEAYAQFVEQYPGLDIISGSIPSDNNFKMYPCDIYYNDQAEQYYVNGNGFTYTDESGRSKAESSFMVFLPKENEASNNTYIKYSGTGSMTEDEAVLIHQGMVGGVPKDQVTIISSSSGTYPGRTLTLANQLGYTSTTKNGYSQISEDGATVDGIKYINKTGSVTIAGFSGGAVTSYQANMELLKNNGGDYTNLSLVDPGALRSCAALFDVNNPEDVENAKLLANSTVVVYTRTNSSNPIQGSEYDVNDDNGSGWKDREDYRIIARNCKDFYVFEAKLEFDYNGNDALDTYSGFDDTKFGAEHVLQNNINNTNISHGSVINSEYDLSMYNLYKPIVDPDTGEVKYKLVESEEERRKIIDYLTMKDKLYRENPIFMNSYDDLKTQISDLRIFCKSFIDDATAELETLANDNKTIVANKAVGAYRSTASTIRYSDLIIAIDYYTHLSALLNTIDNTISFLDYMGVEKEAQEAQLAAKTEVLAD